MVIRLLGAADVESFKSIRLEALREAPYAFGSTVEDWLELPNSEWVRRIVETPVFAAFDGDNPVGLMGLWPEGSGRKRHRASLVMVYVRETHRGTNVADGLLQAAIAHAAELGISQIELHVSVENPRAIRFYERRGFSETGRIPNAIMHNGKAIDELLMVRMI